MERGIKNRIQKHVEESMRLVETFTVKKNADINSEFKKAYGIARKYPGVKDEIKKIEDKIREIGRLILLISGCADTTKQTELINKLDIAKDELIKIKSEFDLSL